jgi:hypothetical protein
MEQNAKACADYILALVPLVEQVRPTLTRMVSAASKHAPKVTGREFSDVAMSAWESYQTQFAKAVGATRDDMAVMEEAVSIFAAKLMALPGNPMKQLGSAPILDSSRSLEKNYREAAAAFAGIASRCRRFRPIT